MLQVSRIYVLIVDDSTQAGHSQWIKSDVNLVMWLWHISTKQCSANMKAYLMNSDNGSTPRHVKILNLFNMHSCGLYCLVVHINYLSGHRISGHPASTPSFPVCQDEMR